jgi:hypothetical protein
LVVYTDWLKPALSSLASVNHFVGWLVGLGL